MQTCVAVPYSAALATDSLQTYLQALHPDAQHSNWRVSSLSGGYCAAYLVYNEALWLALSLRRLAQRRGTLSPTIYALFLIQMILRTIQKLIF